MKFFLTLLPVLLLAQFPCLAQQTGTGKPVDKRDVVTKEWITDVSTNVKFLDHETVYNSEGRKIEETEYTRQGKLWTKKYEYGADGRMSREVTYNERGRIDSIKKFEYDASTGRRSAVYTYDAKGRLVKIKVFEFKRREHVDN